MIQATIHVLVVARSGIFFICCYVQLCALRDWNILIVRSIAGADLWAFLG